MTRKEKKAGKSLVWFYVVLGAVAVVGVGVLGYSVGSSLTGGAVTEPVELEGIDDPQQLFELARGVQQGDPNAPVKLYEFSDYQCPWCARFGLDIKPLLNANYIETGKVLFVYYDFPLIQIHKHSFLAARAARCAGDQGRYWEYHDRLLAEQPRWSARGNVTGDFIAYAVAVGLDRPAFEQCLKSDRHADVVTANLRLAEQLGVQGTPTLYINGKLVRSLSGWEQLRDLIEAELAR